MTYISSRVGDSALSSSLIYSMAQDQSNLVNLQQLLATGNNISKPSDNPVGITNLLGIQTTLARSAQYLSNASDGLSVLGIANGAMSSSMNTLQQIRSALVSAGNASLSPAAVQSIGTQIQGLSNALLGTANTQYLGSAVFAGTTGNTAAYDATGNYLGNSVAPSRVVAPGVTLPASVTSPFGASGSPTNMFVVLNKIVTDLNSGSIASVQTDLGKFDSAFSSVQSVAAQVGAQYQQMQTLKQQMTYSQQTLQTELGGIQNVDVASISTQYQQALSNYQVALYASSKVVQPSLATYLH